MGRDAGSLRPLPPPPYQVLHSSGQLPRAVACLRLPFLTSCRRRTLRLKHWMPAGLPLPTLRPAKPEAHSCSVPAHMRRSVRTASRRPAKASGKGGCMRQPSPVWAGGSYTKNVSRKTRLRCGCIHTGLGAGLLGLSPCVPPSAVEPHLMMD